MTQLSLSKGRRKEVRVSSGVNVVAVMTKPYPCPGRCVMCFGGPEVGSPKSYIGDEPALRRAVLNNFDPYLQVNNRLRQYVYIGHSPAKVELIVMGGTFTALPEDYRRHFVAQCLEAMNDFPSCIPGKDVGLADAQRKNESSHVRCVGITFETRPDYCGKDHIDGMLELGATRVEIGVQTIHDEVLKLIRRGHGVSETIKATRLLKDAGLKVCYHIMPGLPGSTMDMDLKVFKEIFEGEDFKPDMLKIYPTLVVEGSEIYEAWRRGDYEPPNLEYVLNLLCKVKPTVPEWIRIMRIHRDVPAKLIAAGIRRGDLRSLIDEKMKSLGLKCRCIRCREAGLLKLKFNVEPSEEDIKLIVRSYKASGGTELFLSYEDVKQDILIGFLRLRIPSEEAWRPEITPSSALVRELHVYGAVTPLGMREPSSWQHKGYGKSLLANAERIAMEEYDCRKILVTSGVGVRPYYYKAGYKLEGCYVSKLLNTSQRN